MQRRRVLIGALVALIVIGAILFSVANRGVSTLRRLEVGTATFDEVADGTYEGIYEFGRWNYKVRIKIEGGKAIDIDVLSPAGDAFATKVTEAVLQAQTLEIDSVSGATASTNAVLKALENALTGR
jgi:uncharacterized protein with FMN-binding domain